MLSRNHALARSILFGTLTKLGGALVALLGLPIIARSLDVGSYADFLKAISLASALTMLVGAANVVSIRDLATAIAKRDPLQLRETESSTFGLYIGVVLTGCLLATGLVCSNLSHGSNKSLLTAVAAFVLGQSLLQWAEAYRVALRSDYISSICQFIGAISMFALLIAIRDRGVWAISAVYFGIPLLTQAAIAAHLGSTRRLNLRPQFGTRWLRERAASATPILINSAIEYTKIFGSAFVLLRVGGDAAYAQHLTLVLLAARLVNPISLITRPLMPAYIDAIHASDNRWLSRLRSGVALTLLSSLVLGLLVSFTLNTDVLGVVLPSELAEVSRLEVISLTLFLWGHGSTTLLTPLFFAGSRGKSLAWGNGSFVTAGIAIGSVTSVRVGPSAMLFALGMAAAATAIWALWFSCSRLLSTSAESHVPVPTGTTRIRPDASLVQDT